MWIGTRDCRLGKANVDCPSPPYVVPISWNSASFCEIAINATLQKAQSSGAKLPANMRISPMYGLLTSASLRRTAAAIRYWLCADRPLQARTGRQSRYDVFGRPPRSNVALAYITRLSQAILLPRQIWEMRTQM